MASLEGFTHGLYLLWWVQEKQLSPAVVAAVLAAGDIARLLLEVPTGWLADRFGHRASLILGSAIQVVAMLWCWLGEGVPALVAASVLVATGDAFRSGADQALVFRTCAALGREDAFVRIEATTHTFEVCALAGLVVAGGVVASTWGFAAAWIVETALCAAGMAIACAMVEPPPEGGRDSAAGPDTTVRGLIATNGLVGLILPVAFLGSAAAVGSFLAQTAGQASVRGLTVLVAMMTLAEALGAAVAPRVRAANPRGQWLLAVCGLLLIGVSIVMPSAFHPAVLGLAFLEGLGEPLRAAAIQRQAADGVRARAASLASTCDMAFSTVALSLAGIWRSL